jgi:hypothetical protein
MAEQNSDLVMLLMSDDLMSTSPPFAVAKGKRRFRRPGELGHGYRH